MRVVVLNRDLLGRKLKDRAAKKKRKEKREKEEEESKKRSKGTKQWNGGRVEQEEKVAGKTLGLRGRLSCLMF